MKKLYLVIAMDKDDKKSYLLVLTKTANLALSYGRIILGNRIVFAAMELPDPFCFEVIKSLNEEVIDALIENDFLEVDEFSPLHLFDVYTERVYP